MAAQNEREKKVDQEGRDEKTERIGIFPSGLEPEASGKYSIFCF